MDKQDSIDKYIKSMDEQKKKAYQIAKDHLGTSFDITRSNGYNEYIRSSSSETKR